MPSKANCCHVIDLCNKAGIYIPVRGRAELPEQDRVVVRPVLVNEVLHRTDWLEAVRHAVEDESIAPRVAALFAPQEVRKAQEMLQSGGVRGRIVIAFP